MRFYGILASLLLFPRLLFGDASREDWIGSYSINHDRTPVGVQEVCRLLALELKRQTAPRNLHPKSLHGRFFLRRASIYAGKFTCFSRRLLQLQFRLQWGLFRFSERL